MKTLFRISLLLMCLLFTGTTFAQDAPHLLSGTAWSPDGTMIAVVGNYGTVSVYNADGSLKANMVGHFERSMVLAVAWSPDSTRIASGGTDHDVIIWNVNQPGQQAGEMLQHIKNHHADISDVAWSPDGLYLATSSGNSVSPESNNLKMWHWNGTAFSLLKESTDEGIINIEWSPDSSKLVLSRATGIYVIDAQTFATVHTLSDFDTSVSADWNSNGTQLAVSIWDGSYSTITIYNTDSYADVKTLEGGGSIAWSPDDTRIASIGRKTVKILDVASEKVIATYPMTKETMNTSFGWSPDSVYFAYGDTGSAPVIVMPPSTSDEITGSDSESPEPAAVAQR